MNLSELFSSGLGNKAISSITESLNLDESKTKWVTSAAVPLMMSALNYNAQKSPEQQQQINKAMDQHSGNFLDQISGIFQTDQNEDNQKIVQHIFGKNTAMVSNTLAAKTGLSSEQVDGVLGKIAPILMSFLGNQKQQSTKNEGLQGLLNSVLGNTNSQESTGGGMINNLLGSLFGGKEEQQKTTENFSLDGLSKLSGEFFQRDADETQKENILEQLVSKFGK